MACWSWMEVRIMSSETFLCTSDRASASERRAGLHTFRKKRRSRHGHGLSAVITLSTGQKWQAESALQPRKNRRRWPRTSRLSSGTFVSGRSQSGVKRESTAACSCRREGTRNFGYLWNDLRILTLHVVLGPGGRRTFSSAERRRSSKSRLQR